MALIIEQEAFLISYRSSRNVTLAAKKANISRTTYYSWLKNSVEFQEAKKQADEEFLDYVDAAVQNMAQKNPIVMIFWAKNNYPQKYGEKIIHELGQTFTDWVRNAKGLVGRSEGLAIPSEEPRLLGEGNPGDTPLDQTARNPDVISEPPKDGGQVSDNGGQDGNSVNGTTVVP